MFVSLKTKASLSSLNSIRSQRDSQSRSVILGYFGVETEAGLELQCNGERSSQTGT